MKITLDIYFTGKTHFGQMVTLCHQSKMSVRKLSRYIIASYYICPEFPVRKKEKVNVKESPRIGGWADLCESPDLCNFVPLIVLYVHI